MVAERTLDRLRHAVAAHAAAMPAQPPRPDPPPIDRILGVDRHETPFGAAFVRDEWFPSDHRHGKLPLSAPLTAPGGGLRALLGAADAAATRLAFFDIETTGLAGGTGTYIVLAGLGSYEDGAFRVRQYFLADLAAERAMLWLLMQDLAAAEALVTYNGRAFDLPVLQTRVTLARLPSSFDRLPHVDLLHAVRRLYRHRLPTCRLAEAERHLLRIDRPDDIPGWLIPSLYFDYVRAGRAAPLRAVFRHNADDVMSLAGVLAAVATILGAEAPDPDDAIAAGNWWERDGDEARALALYGRALPWLEGGDDWHWVARRYARLCKRAGRRQDAVAVWRELWDRGDRAAGLELAKHHEHHERDLHSAHATTRALLDPAPDIERAALEHRLARLTRKLARYRR